ncbi:hypothetical protein IJ579_04115 [bacterium]|nr:hypothetical protein [bacterium]
MGNFSKEWMYLNCNAGHHCLGVRLKEPVYFDGKQTTRLYVTKVDDSIFENNLLRKTKNYAEDFGGNLFVWAFNQDPKDEQLVELEMDNIDTISILK